MKIIFLLIALSCGALIIHAQNPLSQNTQVELGVGFIVPSFRKGTELMRSYDLRKDGLSYFADNNGNRKSVGNYSGSSGYNITIGFYKPMRSVKGLMLGALVRNAQTGSTPENRGYEEAYFFNFITAGLVATYYAFVHTNLFAKADFGMAAVLTKNRFINDANQQSFFHQFGIGNSQGLAVGYALQLFKDKAKAVVLFYLVNIIEVLDGLIHPIKYWHFFSQIERK